MLAEPLDYNGPFPCSGMDSILVGLVLNMLMDWR